MANDSEYIWDQFKKNKTDLDELVDLNCDTVGLELVFLFYIPICTLGHIIPLRLFYHLHHYPSYTSLVTTTGQIVKQKKSSISY